MLFLLIQRFHKAQNMGQGCVIQLLCFTDEFFEHLWI